METGSSERSANGAERLTPLKDFLGLLVKTVKERCDLDSKISLEELSAENSLYAELGSGFTETAYYGKRAVKTIPVLFLCRDEDQERCVTQLESICDCLQCMESYPQCETVAWMDTVIAKEPSKIGRDEDGVYHYSCILNNKIYY